MIRVIIAAVAIYVVCGCAAFTRVEPPAADCGKAILDDAAKGMSVAQIVDDVGPRCGSDAASVIAALLASKERPGVAGSRALGEALRAQVAQP